MPGLFASASMCNCAASPLAAIPPNPAMARAVESNMTNETESIGIPRIDIRAAFIRVLGSLIDSSYSMARESDNFPSGDYKVSLAEYQSNMESAVKEAVQLLVGADADMQALSPVLRKWVNEAGYCWPEVDSATGDVPDPVVNVTLPGTGGARGEWRISTDLTDRWGDINEHEWPRKPFIALLGEGGHMDRLLEQMQGEMTSLARKDGRFGLLFEVEHECWDDAAKESNPPHDAVRVMSHDCVVKRLAENMAKIAEGFPGLDFCIPDATPLQNGRVVAWAFMPDGALTPSLRESLEGALQAL
jgi:hypothetical protein